MNIKFDHYNKDGTTYSIYTHQPAKLVSLEDAPAFCDMTKRAFTIALKKYPSLRAFEGDDVKDYLDFELQTWLNTVRQDKALKPVWKNGLRKLKDLLLIDRSTLIDKMDKLFKTEWDDTRRFAHRFDDRKIAAYQQGVKECLAIVKSHLIEAWDYTPSLDDVVRHRYGDGIIRKITDDRVLVDTIMLDVQGDIEHWLLEYKLSDLEAVNIPFIWDYTETPDCTGNPYVWDYRGIPYVRIL
jgi:hypothetical protein